MAQATQITDVSLAEVKSVRSLIPSFMVGAVVGLVFWALFVIFKEYIVGYIACRVGTSLVDCGSNSAVSGGLALIIASLGGLIALIRRRILRPLLVVIASVISLWGVAPLIEPAGWGVELLLFIGLTGLVYAVFTWLNDIRRFWVALAVSLVVAVIFQLLLSS